MREIKFRFYNKIEKRMYKNMLQNELCIKGNSIGHNFYSELDDRFDVMQFTGLLDKQGVEIYEGDIVIHSHPEMKKETFKVVYDAPMFLYKSLLDNENWAISIPDHKYIEVIGNIYENRDLLNG